MKLIYKLFFLSVGLFLLPNWMAAQRTVSGTITDAATGEPLIGATVLVKGFSTGTVTDFDGKYSIGIPEETEIITFSYTGYTTIDKSIGSSNQLDVQMNAGAVLEEVVVIGYGTIKKEDATGSVQTVNSEQFNKGAITGPQELLAGKVAGVTISTNSGAPGEGATIRIRGESSVSASNNPLIVIDGVPLANDDINGARNPLNIINPNDIETFTVLKDASASAIYGNRASGGVIIITTKKGAVGKGMKVGYNGNISIGVIDERTEVLDARGFSALITDRFGEGSREVELLGTADTDWQSEIYQTAIGHDHNISLSGAVKSLPYRVSLGYTNKNGLLRTDNFERFVGGVNLNPGFLDNTLQVNFSLKGMRINNQFANRGAIGSAIGFDPTKPVLDPESPYGGFWTWTDSNGLPIALAPANPLAQLELRDDRSTVNRLITNLQVDYRLPFLPALRANLNLGYDRSDSDGTIDVPAEASFAFFNGGEVRTYSQGLKNELLEFYLNYKEDFGQHTLDLLAGYSWQHFFEESFSQGSNIDGTEILQAPNNNAAEHFLVSVFGRLNYSFQDRYLLTATLRRDGTSRFSPDNRFGIFPALAAGIKIVNNPTSKGLSNLKLRFGWGVTGQEDINDNRYAYLPIYQAGFDNAQYQFGNDFINTSRPNGYDANIRWEETATYNAAIDFGLLQDKLTGTLEIYQRNTKDLLNFVPVPAGTNLTNFITTNVGDLENKGIELSLNATPIQTKDQTLDIGFNIAYNENEITRLTATDDPSYQGVLTGGIAGGVGSTIQIFSVGFPARSFYVFEQVYDEFGVPVEGLYVDRNQDGVINGDDQYRLEKPAADYSLGYTARYAYKNFDISMAGRASIGNYVYNNVWSDGAFYNRLSNLGIINNVNPVITQIDFSNPQYFSDHFVRDASFLRIDHITVGYNFDDLLGDFMRLYLTVQNPAVFTNYEGIDPEIVGGDNPGVDNNIYPRPRTFVFGVSVNF